MRTGATGTHARTVLGVADVCVCVYTVCMHVRAHGRVSARAPLARVVSNCQVLNRIWMENFASK